MQSMEASRRRHLGFAPPASEESAASPVIVNVRTVVVKSAIASRRTVALRSPIAIAVRMMTANSGTESPPDEPRSPSAAPALASRSAASKPKARLAQ
jgi:hypothetical protein